MKRTSVAELKARLSHFLHLAQEGETVEVESHHHPVARIVPVDDASRALVIPPDLPVEELANLRGVRVAASADPVGALLRDRARR